MGKCFCHCEVCELGCLVKNDNDVKLEVQDDK